MTAGVGVNAGPRCSDRYTSDLAAGTVVGSVAPDGTRRTGVDAEGLIGIDNGALRFRPLERPGWGREGIAYGPFEPVPGLAFAALVLNGHNASQTFYFPETGRKRARRVLVELLHIRPRREHHYENLALGFCDDPRTVDPIGAGPALVMHAANEHNGELWVTHAGRSARTIRGVQNLPFLFVVALREGSAAFYTASLPGAVGAGPFPMLRPAGIDPSPVGNPVFAGIQQRILGEVGYRVDSRIYGIEVAVVEGWRHWFGTAVVADQLTGAGKRIESCAPDAGGPWRVDGAIVRSADGARTAAAGPSSAARIEVNVPVGLVHAVVQAGCSPGTAEIRWRMAPDGGHLAVLLGSGRCEVVSRDAAGTIRVLATDVGMRMRPGVAHAVQVLDDTNSIAVNVDSVLVGGVQLDVAEEVTVEAGYDVGFFVCGDVAIRDFEAHPRNVRLPDALDCGSPWSPPASGVSWQERFDATAPDLDGASTPSGGRLWTRVEGVGTIELLGDHARASASLEHPFPDRALFTVPWHDPGYAHLELEMTIPGTGKGQGHKGRCGVVFWQDPGNYLIVNFWVDDVYPGASISTFYRLGGHEDMYDAVWTLVQGVEWGRRCRLWATFDGERFVAGTGDEPCLVRALRDVFPDAPPMRIERAGIVVNEEWGNDTGTVLHRFSGAERAAATSAVSP